MIGRTLAKRLDRLETRMLPSGEPMIMQIVFVAADGTEADGPRFVIPGAGGRPLGTNPK
jgi:hypothetical protein